MDSKSLMIGDWVLYNGDGKPYPVQVAEITSLKQLKVYNGKELIWFICGEKFFEPIPPTAEILEKNGFERHNRYRYLHIDNYCKVCVSIAPRVKIYDMDLGEPPINVSIEGALFDINMSISAIHELQRALRCCGLWDLANNFKID